MCRHIPSPLPKGQSPWHDIIQAITDRKGHSSRHDITRAITTAQRSVTVARHHPSHHPSLQVSHGGTTTYEHSALIRDHVSGLTTVKEMSWFYQTPSPQNDGTAGCLCLMTETLLRRNSQNWPVANKDRTFVVQASKVLASRRRIHVGVLSISVHTFSERGPAPERSTW